MNKIENWILLYVCFFVGVSIAGLCPAYSGVITKVPVAILILRELLFFLPLFFLIFCYSESRYIVYTSLLCFLLFLQVVYLTGFTPLVVLGFKTIVPLLFLFTLPKSSGVFSVSSVKKLLTIIFVLNFSLQIVHLFWGNGYYAKFAFGMNARNPGIMFYPAASAFLTVILFAMYLKLEKQVNLTLVLLYLLSVTLCASLTGMAGAMVLVLRNFSKFPKKGRFYVFPMLIFGLLYLHEARMQMTGSSYISETGGGRINIAVKVNKVMRLLPERFGLYTNAAVNYYHGTVTDSLYSSFMGNLGDIWAVVVSIFLIALAYLNYKSKQNMDIVYLTLFCSFGLNVPETGLPIFIAILSRFISPEDNSGSYENCHS